MAALDIRPEAHPFVRAAADGTLPAAAFDRWLVEDHHFVVGFRRFLAHLVELAPDEATRDLLAGAFVPLQSELDLFRSEAGRRGLDLGAEPSPTTLGYTSFLLAAPAEGWPVALAVLHGAEQAYVDAWTAVRTEAEASSPYWAFIDNWSAPQFAAWVDALADLAAGLEAHPSVELAAARVVRFELRFWSAVHEGETW
jgi:thiaminase/transcriptional activator TenA